MMRRTLLAAGGAAGLLLLATSCRSERRYRYRVTVDVRTPEGMKSDSAVQELVHLGSIPWLPGGGTYMTEIHGEAVAIDLPADTLFMLLRVDSDRLIESALLRGRVMPPIDVSAVTNWPWSRVKLLDALERSNAQIIVTEPFDDIVKTAVPWVRFENLKDPLSFSWVDPGNISFQQGTYLHRIVIDFKDNAASTDKISALLPWVSDLQKYEKTPGAVGSGPIPSELYGLKN